ncbi:MAG: phosphopyruvate hydratase [Candidatus Neomarinimicrobiota bacterium]|nr:phosphopyruvate hydratase [Candidatus Neomarinimicrobiota bacterium]
MSDSSIATITGREILDSRGNPTVEVDVFLSDGSHGRAAVPSGASTGEHEAVELRDGDSDRYMGKGVLKAVQNVNVTLQKAVKGKNAIDQESIDRQLIEADETPNKNILGANAILGVSMAVCRAAAIHERKPLWKYLSSGNSLLPAPMMNILNGGIHADNNVDVQEFMVYPLGADSFSEGLRTGTEIFHHLKGVLKSRGLNTSVGDEGGFAPDLKSNEEAIEVILEAIDKSGFKVGQDVFLTLDAAASEFYDEGLYHLYSENLSLSSEEMVNYWQTLVEKYPIVSIEDGLDENDWDGWSHLNKTLGNTIQIVGDDLTVTNLERLQRAVGEQSMNAILIKLNQIGTVTETIQAVELARKNNFAVIISHRSGETEDSFIADFSVAMGMGQIKTGSASRTDRLCKYNQLLRIEEQLGGRAGYPDKSLLGKS